jgi:hypothetical protein
VERTTWTDQRLDDLSSRVDRGFERVDQRFQQVDRRFDQVDRRFEETNRRIYALGYELRTEIDSLRVTILRVGGGMMVGLLGVIAAVLARGV